VNTVEISPLTRRAGELCLDLIRDVAPDSEPTVDFTPLKSGGFRATFTATIGGERKSTSVELTTDDWDIDEGEFEAQLFWFAVNRELVLGAPDGVPKSLRPRRKGPIAIPGKSNKPVMGFWR
jgi:hypothetical protein